MFKSKPQRKKSSMSLSCFSWCHSPEESTVSEIDLSNSLLHDVPTSIFLHERTLTTLHINSNRIRDLPLPLFYCQNLQFLNLSDNDIAHLPVAIGSLINLTNLDLSKNCIQMVNDAIKGCKKLSILNLSTNPLRQFPEPVTQLIGLEELYLNDTTLDYLPANIGRLVKLRILELRDNRLSTLPRAIARFSSLQRLDIGQNDFTYLPEVVGDLVELQELWLDLNGMVEVPRFVGNLKNLTHLDISENSIEDIPEEIGECQKLTELTLSSNDIRSLPLSFGRIGKSLITLKLDANELSSLPFTIGDLWCLEELYLASNKLETLPSSIGLLRKLISLEIDSNRIHHLPPEIGSCASLRILTVQNNLIRHIPAEIGNLANLTVLSITNNKLQHLPMSLLKLTRLKALWLVYNQSKPLTPLVREYDVNTHSMVLTCYLLPQSDHHLDILALRKAEEKLSSHKQKVERPRIRFCINPAQERQSVLMRAPTPYPKKLRELAKCARAIASQSSQSQPEVNTQLCHSVVNVRGTSPLVDQVRTAVKKHTPSVANGSVVHELPRGTETPMGLRLQQPPPYHIAAAFSKQATLFQSDSSYIHKEERRTDLDTEALSNLKDELLHHLPPNDCQLSQSEQSGSVDLVYPPANGSSSDRACSRAMSDVDSAFVDNVESNYKNLEPRVINITTNPKPPRSVNDGTYSAYPGRVITESPSEGLPSESNEYDSSSYPISKVNSWLTSKTKSPVTGNGCEFINMYPCEGESNNNKSIQGPSSSVAVINKKEEFASPKASRPSKLPWLFGVHKNPKVVEVVINKTGSDLGFEISVLNSGIYVKNVSPHLREGLREGDKILQVEGIDVNDTNMLRALRALLGPFTMMISRQT